MKFKLGDALIYEQPTKYIVSSTQYNDEFKIPVLTAGQSFILGYTNETENIYNEFPVIIFDDFTTAIKFVDFPFKVKSSAMKILKPNTNICDIRYMYYLMSTIKIKCSEHKRYWISKFSNITIELPPLKIQKRIAEILDTADSLRQKDKLLIEKYNQLTQSLFLEMFGDPVRNKHKFKVGSIRDLVTEVKYGTSAKSEEGGAYPYLRMNNITYEGYLDLSDLKYINLTEGEKNKYLLRKGDVLFNRTNSKELVGKTGIWESDGIMAIAGYLIRVRVNEKANPYFIWGYLNSKHGKLTLEICAKALWEWLI